eukprot:2595858-Prymnesium_polylepis.1
MRREPGLERGSMPARLLRPTFYSYNASNSQHIHCTCGGVDPRRILRAGVWPMVRRKAVSSATRLC